MIERDYKEWLRVHYRKLVENRAKPVILNLVGEKLGIEGDGLSSGDEEYDDDDDSINATSEDEQESSSSMTAFGDEDDNEDDEVLVEEVNVKRRTRRFARDNLGNEKSDSDALVNPVHRFLTLKRS